jgi:hypothetical protein
MRPTDSTGTKIAKGFARVPVAILTFGLSEAWHARERAMESWLGHNQSELVMAWGPPTAVLDDGNGGQIFVYTETRTYVSPGSSTTTSSGSAYGQVYGNQVYVQGQEQSHTMYSPAQVHQWQVFRQFRIDSNGRIVQYSWRGL